MIANKFIKGFRSISLNDIASVGGKNASLGELISSLASKGIQVPDGFAITATAFWYFIDHNKLREPLAKLFIKLDRMNFSNLREIGEAARNLMKAATMPVDLFASVVDAYKNLCGPEFVEVAVRSSATAEDLPQASFAGQHDSFLNIKGDVALMNAVQQCFASLFTDRAIKYREDNGFDQSKVALSVGIQKMVRSDKACSGIGFTLEPESGFRDIIHLSGVWGLGENIVQGSVTPDEYFIFKPSLRKGKNGIIQKKMGMKEKTMIYGDIGSSVPTINIPTVVEKREQFVLTDEEILTLASWADTIDLHYAKPMDIEWAKDGLTGQLYIIQARPETVHSRKNPFIVKEYTLLNKGQMLAEGEAIGTKLVTGVARIINSPGEADALQAGEIIVSDLTSPDWDPLLKRSLAIVTNKGGRTSHASIVARELGVPAIVGTGNATETIVNGELITVSCCEGRRGFIYKGKVDYAVRELDFGSIKKPQSTKVMMIVGDPEKAFVLSFYPNDGVGLMRIEFIITHYIQAHPMALIKFETLKDLAEKQKIEQLTHHYPDKRKYFLDNLSQGIAVIAAAFYPKDVIVRFSDFKTNEYANLIGGKEFEPKEENPMIGFRGASRYYNDLYKEGFRMECQALKKVREEMGLTNVIPMIPFCRTVEEGEKVIAVMEEYGLDRKEDQSLQIYMMAEIPSNVMLADEFAELFDGFSIGSNDLTQLTLGVDRDSNYVSGLFDEQNKASKMMIAMMIQRSRASGRPIGLCGQAPSDFPEFAQFLVEEGIDSISFNPDALLKGIENINNAEAKSQKNLQTAQVTG